MFRETPYMSQLWRHHPQGGRCTPRVQPVRVMRRESVLWLSRDSRPEALLVCGVCVHAGRRVSRCFLWRL